MTGPVVHPLLQEAVVGEIERAASEHRGSRWVCGAFTDLDDLASHSCGVFHGEPFSVFAKLSDEANAVEQFTAELAGLKLLRDSAQVATPTPIGTGVVRLPVGSLLLFEALAEQAPPDPAAAIGRRLWPPATGARHAGRTGRAAAACPLRSRAGSLAAPW
jgi:hypothetical protein